MTFSVYFPYLCGKLVQTKTRISLSQQYSKLRIMYLKGLFHDTPVQLAQNVQRFPSWGKGPLGLCSTKAENMVQSTVSMFFASLYTKDLERRWAAKSSNCKQSHALPTNNAVSMNHCALLMRSRPSHVTLLRTYSTKANKMVKSRVSVLFAPLCTKDI